MFSQVRTLIASDLMCELNQDELRQKFGDGTIFIACSDCDRFHGYFTDLAQPFGGRVHAIALNGGAILLDPSLPARAGSHGEAIARAAQAILGVTGVEGAKALKENLDLIALLSHFPCGMAKVLDMKFLDSIVATLSGKAMLKDRFGEDQKILALMSVDWRASDESAEHERGIKTYAISLKNWVEIQALLQ